MWLRGEKSRIFSWTTLLKDIKIWIWIPSLDRGSHRSHHANCVQGKRFPSNSFGDNSFLVLFFQGRELVGNDVSGALCVRSSIPSMSRTIYGHHERFLDTYYRPYPGASPSPPSYKKAKHRCFWFTDANRKSLFRNYILPQRTTRTESSLFSRVNTSTHEHWLQCRNSDFRLTSVNQKHLVCF